ncbi:Phox domain containing protein [Quillaja saponaria]|uniref:Phox domain containing protein n=1 Tax=Quillaja saponaria TaxID=32244 RepID=A0AAD7P8B4_QUISA|nr:Phox domain containing protein [Quillaja saponaria]
MINGEGIRDINSELASPDPFNSFPSLRVLKFDGGDTSPVSSRYSSCGESDFDRYCSANSVMGTPSMCSTITSFNDCTESEFGSLKNFGIGDDNGLENFSLGGRLERNYKDQGLSSSGGPDRLSDGTTGSCKENIDKQPSIKYGSSGLELYGNDNELFTMSYQGVHGAGDEIGLVRVEGESGLGVGRLSKDRDKDVFSGDDEEGSTVCTGNGQLRGVGGDCVEKGTTNEIGNAGSTESYFSGNKDEKSSQFLGMVGEGCSSSTVHGEEDSDGLDTQSNLKFGGRETEREEDDNSSKYQYSEGEDSMYNYGTDDDNKNELYFPRNLHYHQESKGENGNPLLMNSSVVFGSEDWDDFMLETEGSYGISHTFDGFLKQKEKNPEVKESIINFASTSSKDFSSDGSHEQARDTKCMAIGSNKVEDIYEAEKMDSCSEVPFGSQALGEPEEVKDGGDIHGTCCQVQGTEFTKKSSNSSTGFQIIIEPQQENVREIHDAINQVQGAENLVTCSIYNADLDPWADTAPLATGLSIMDYSIKEKGHQCKNTEDAVSITHTQHIENADLAISKVKSDILSDITVAKVSSSVEPPGNIETQFFEDHKSDALPSNFEMRKSVKSSLSSTDFFEEASATSKMENFELNEFYDELVHEMEEILLDSVDSPGARFPQGNRMLLSHLALPSRDGGSKASTSGTDDTYPLVQHSVRVDEIEVVGARQKKGDVSFSERLVGVKEYTVYKIKVSSGKVQWEVERRYRDFLTLYRRMKTLFTEQGWDLPAPWTLVEKETRKIFGSASPDVIEERSVLIQECLRSILHSREDHITYC